ncbi:exocyst complex component exo70 [Savitreella phatthalungensis]
MPAIDEERADLEVLQDNLTKTDKLTARMAEILKSFDARLEQLERVVEPIYASGETLKRQQDNISATIRAIEKTRQYYNIPFEEEARIKAGPLENPHAYIKSLQRIDNGLASIDLRLEASQKIASRMQQLQQQGRAQLEDSIESCLRDNAKQIEPLPFVLKDQPLPSLPPETLEFLSVACEPERYVASRSAYLQRSLYTFVLASQRNLEIRTSTLYDRENNGIGHYTEAFIRMALVEKAAAAKVVPGEFPKIVGPAFQEYLGTVKAIAGHIMDRPSTDCYLGFETLEHMRRLQASLPELGLDTSMALVASSCAPAFYELLQLISRADFVPASDAGIVDLTRDVTTRLVRFSQYRAVVLDLIYHVGENNWRAPLNGPVRLGQAPVEEATSVFDGFAAEVAGALVTHIEGKARATGRKPGFVGVVCLNNTAALQHGIGRSDLSPMAPRTTPAKLDDLMKRGFKLYRESWDVSARPLMDTTVMRTVGDKRQSFTNKDREALKDRFRTFNTEFETSIRDFPNE